MQDTKDNKPSAAGAETARTIYQTWLDQVDKLLWERDFDGVAAAMRYPHTMATADTEIEVATPEDLFSLAMAFRERLDQMSAHAYCRICVEARSIKGAVPRLLGQHVTYILRGGQFVVEPFVNDMVLIEKDGAWFGGGILAGVENATCTMLSPEMLRGSAAAE